MTKNGTTSHFSLHGITFLVLSKQALTRVNPVILRAIYPLHHVAVLLFVHEAHRHGVPFSRVLTKVKHVAAIVIVHLGKRTYISFRTRYQLFSSPFSCTNTNMVGPIIIDTVCTVFPEISEISGHFGFFRAQIFPVM